MSLLPADTLAAELMDAEARGVTLPPIVARTPGFDLEASYAVQARITRERLARGWSLIGRKIGFTNRNIWALYGVDAPMWAPLFEQTVIRAENGIAEVPLAGTVQPRIEPEILFCLAGSPPAGLRSPEEVLPYVAWYAHSIEIVQSHYPRWKAAGITILDPARALVSGGETRIVLGGKPLYFDSHHLSIAGARAVLEADPRR